MSVEWRLGGGTQNMKNGWITLRGGDRINIFRTMPFYLVHLGCLAAFFLKFHWSYLVVCLSLYYVRMFFVTARLSPLFFAPLV